MLKTNVATNTFKFILLKIIGDFIYFPVWWYSKGLAGQAKIFSSRLKQTERYYSLGIWLKNMFVPMYGMYDVWSRVISFFMRLVMLIFKLIGFLIAFIFYLVLFLIYLVLPAAGTFMFIRAVFF